MGSVGCVGGQEGDRIEIPRAQRVHGPDVEWSLGHFPLVHHDPRLGAANFFEYPVRDGSGLGNSASLAEVLSGVKRCPQSIHPLGFRVDVMGSGPVDQLCQSAEPMLGCQGEDVVAATP